jgi:hypothetical protein
MRGLSLSGEVGGPAGALGALLALLLILLLGVGADRASAAGAAPADAFTLSLSVPAAVEVGKPDVIRAVGTIPVRSLPYLHFVGVFSIRPEVMDDCPGQYWEASQIALSTGGAVLALSQRVAADGAGRFTIPVGVSPYAAGAVRLCAYIGDGETMTLARASALLTIRQSTTLGHEPQSVSPPRVARSRGLLTCSAGRWTENPRRYAFEWVLGGRRIAGGATIPVSRAVRGKAVRCVVTASNSFGSATATSGAVVG